jgi:hypothetical protein
MPVKDFLAKVEQRESGVELESKPVREPTDKEKSFLARVKGRTEATETSATGNFSIAQTLDSKSEVEAAKFAKNNGVSMSLAREAVQKLGLVKKPPSPAARKSPSINKYYGRDVNNAGVSKDDSEGLLNVEREVNEDIPSSVNVDGSIPINFEDPTAVSAAPILQKRAQEEVKNMSLVEKTKRAFDVGRHNLTVGAMRYDQIFDDVPEREETIQRFKEKMPVPVAGDNLLEDFTQATAGMIPLVVQSLVESQKAGLAAATGAGTGALIAGQAGPQVALPEEIITVPAASALGYAAGTTAGAATNIFRQETGLFYDEALQLRDENGQPIDKDVLKPLALGYGLLSTYLEMVGLKYISKTIPGGEKLLGKLTKTPIKKIVQKSPTIRKALADIGKRFIKGGVGEGITEGTQKVASILTTELAKFYAENKEGAYFLPFDWQNAFKEVKTDVYFGTLGGFGLGSPGTIISSVNTVHNVNKSKNFQKKIAAINKIQNESETYKVSPEHSERFLNETDIQKEAYLSPEGAERLFQTDSPEAAAIVKKLGLDVAEVRERILSGQDISIDLPKAIAQLTDPELEILQKHLKPKPDSYTGEQIEQKAGPDEIENIKEVFEEVTADDLVFQSDLDRIKKQIVETGQTEEVAEANTALVERFSNSLALQGQDRAALLEKLEFKKVGIIERLTEKGKRLLQGDIAEDLNFELTTIETRLEKITPEMEGGPELIDKLEKQKVDVKDRLRETAEKRFETLLQEQEGKAALDLIINPKTRVIEKATVLLGDMSNLASIPHELGHFFLREMDVVAQTEGVTDQFKSDMSAIREWLGMEDGATEFTVPQQEQFAQGFVSWLREGKAPNEQLDTVFARFKRWLTEVYKSARKLNVELNKDIREVFNRMLDSEIEVNAAAAINNMVPPTADRMNDLGILNDEQADLKGLVNKAIEKADSRLFRDREKAIKENKDRFTKEAEAEVRAEDRPGEVFGVYDVIDDIKANGLQFSRQEYNEYAGSPNAYKFLPAKNLTSKRADAITLDVSAIAYGFDSADTFAEAMGTTPPLDIAIDARVDLKNKALTETFIAEDYIANTQEYSDYIDRMGSHIRKAGGVTTKAITREQMKAFARDKINEMSVSEAQRTDKFLAAMKRAAVAMRKAEKAKDYAKAIRENEKMQLNHEMARESVRNKKTVNSFVNRVKKFRKLGRPSTVSLRYREGVRALAERFSIVPNVAPQNPVDVDKFTKLLKGDEHIGEFVASDFLKSEKIRDYRKISMNELKELDDLVKFFNKVGRDEQTGLLSDGVTKKEDIVAGSVEEMNAIKPQKVHDRFAIRRKTSGISRKFFANLLGLPYITKALGGYKALKGVVSFLETHITEKLKDVEDARLRRFDEVKTAIQSDVDHIVNAQRRLIKENKGQKLFDSGVEVPDILQDNGTQVNYWTPEQIMAIAFNRGNESNLSALLAGYSRGASDFTLGQVDTLLNKYLTREDMNAVQNILDAMEKLFPETDKVHVAMKGFHMNKVKAQEWTFKGKKYRGGYYPLNFDRVLSDWIAGQKEAQDFFESEDAKFTVPFAASTHTIKRIQGHALPVDLRLIHIYSHLDKAVRYITHAETIRDIDRIITDKDFKAAAIKALGKDVYQQIRPSLKHVANPHVPGVDIPGRKMVGYLRGVATSANLALNTMVAMKQVYSTPSAIHDMGLGDGGGFKAYLRGMVSVVSSPAVHFNTMIKLSPYMKERITSWERDLLRPKFNRMTPAQREIAFGNKHVTWSDVVNLGFFEIKAMDTATVMPIWWGTYYDVLNENSTNEAEAIRAADNIVRDTQPSATALDLSGWFREGGFFSLFNLHQTFTVGKFGQRQRTYYRAWRDGKVSTKDYAWFNFMDAFLPLISMNVMVAWLRSGDLSDEEEWWEIAQKTVQSWLFMGIPIAGAFVDAITNSWRDPLEVPGARQVKRTARVIGSLGKGTDGFTQKEKSDLYMGMFWIASDFSRVPAAKLYEKADDGDTFKEKMFGKKPKRR